MAASAARNESPIIDALGPALGGRTGTMLEIGSGTGQHSAAWARAFPALDWQPSDPHAQHHVSIAAWVAHAGLPNLRAPILLDAATAWPVQGPLAGVISVNVIHIAPWAVAEGIVQGAAQTLDADGVLIFYGPFRQAGQHTGEGNAAFDRNLRAQDPAWGIRDLDEVAALATAAGFSQPEITDMPANNRLVRFQRGAA